MKKLFGLAVICAGTACFGAPTATRTYVDKAIEAEATRADAAIEAAANAAKSAAVAEAKTYTDSKTAGGSGGVTNGVTQAQAEAIAAVAASQAKSEAIAAAATDAATKASAAKTEAIEAAGDDATIKANAAKSSAIETASADATSKANAAKTEAIATAGENADTKIATALTPYAKSEAIASNYLSKVDAAVTYQAKGDYATTSQVSAALEPYAKKSEIPSAPDLSGYATTTSMNSAIASATNGLAKASDVSSQLSSKANDNAVVKLTGTQTIGGAKTFSTLPKIPQTPSAATDAASKGYVDASTNALLTTVEGKGYLTSHQSLANYSTTAQMNTAINNATNGLAKASDVSTQISNATTGLAQDSAVVKLTTAQTISGNKTFSGTSTFSGSVALNGTTTVDKTPTNAKHAANKDYVDNSVKAATNAAVASAVATANAYADSKEGYGKAYDLRPLTNNLTLEDHSTYYVTIAEAMSITLPKAETHSNARCIQIFFECNLATAPTVTVVKNGNTILYQPEDYGGPRESSEYFQPTANGKTMVHLFELKPNVFYIQQINLKNWEY